MNNLKHTFLICAIVVIVRAIEDEDDRSHHEDEQLKKESARRIITEPHLDDAQRRFLAQYDDENWHVSHLKDTDFEGDYRDTRRSGCKEETFADKIKRYRKNLRNDAAFIDFVSADALPFDEKDLIDPCKPNYKKGDNNAGKTPDNKANTTPTKDPGEKVSKNESDATVATNETEHLKSEEKHAKNKTEQPVLRASNQTHSETHSKPAKHKVKGKKNTPKEGTEIKDTATTVKGVKQVVKNDTKDAGRRASEYLFSSIEYYDDTIDFDLSVCPDAVQVVDMEIDMIRAYDVECELALEWWSLD